MNLWPSLAALAGTCALLVVIHRSSREYPWAGMPRRRFLEWAGFALAGWLAVFAVGWIVYQALALAFSR